ncbi:MAG: imidazole glycerol phosphate synthase subunit HisH [Candidatus Azobacteroides sp.]|nr:imidazole glycerol phosphate synthase subunit HisH [Candidatus Azobacteroides sp.]
MNIVIVKYNAGNIYSVDYGLKRLGITPVITDDKEKIQAADKVIFPGQGEANSTMNYLKKHRLDEVICNLKQPVLGICIGMQLMCTHSEENNTPCLGIFDSTVKKFIAKEREDKIPHMGWNTLENVKGNLITSDLANEFVYFVHSYYVPLSDHTVAVTNYIQPFSSALNKDNFYATQFHPEKSGKIGEKILNNFLTL